MARMPDADWLGEHSPEPPTGMDRYDIVCVHTIVGFAPAHAAHFSTWADGRIGQSRDTRYRSGANLNGNHRVIAIENEDHGPRFGGTPRLPGWVPLTPEQVEANAQILAWAHKVHGIPLQLCPNSRPESRGLAYHRQGIDGNFSGYRFPGRVSGGQQWTTSFGKVCPTDARIAQLPEILARAKEIVNNEEDDLSKYEDQLNEIQSAVEETRDRVKAQEPRLRKRIEGLRTLVKRAAEQSKGRDKRLADELEAALAADEAEDSQ
jgi:hypothetical protein